MRRGKRLENRKAFFTAGCLLLNEELRGTVGCLMREMELAGILLISRSIFTAESVYGTHTNSTTSSGSALLCP
jgi:hypothetical protein